MNRTKLLTLGLATLMLAGAAQADRKWDHPGRGNAYGRDWNRGNDYARVLHVAPLISRQRVSVPIRDCDYRGDSGRDYVRDYAYDRRAQDRAAGTILGGVAGAVIGHQLGHGDERKVGAVAGAVLGAAIGNEVARNDNRYEDRDGRRYDQRYDQRYDNTPRCRTTHEWRYDERIHGYRVTYEYGGRRYITEMPYDPGRRLRVGVDVRPL